MTSAPANLAQFSAEKRRVALHSMLAAGAMTLLKLAAGLGPSSVLDTLNQRLALAKATAAASLPDVAESSLTRINAIGAALQREHFMPSDR